VALYKATEPASGVSFNLIDPETNERIRMQTVNVHGELVDEGHRHRTVRRRGRHRPFVLG
jgi:non-homologous end joining protein Ku